MTSDKKWREWPHEGWCDTQNDISDLCNCMVGGYIDSLDEANAKIERLKKENKELKGVQTLFGDDYVKSVATWKIIQRLEEQDGSQKQIIKKLKVAIKRHHKEWATEDQCFSECSYLCKVLKQVEEMEE